MRVKVPLGLGGRPAPRHTLRQSLCGARRLVWAGAHGCSKDAETLLLLRLGPFQLLLLHWPHAQELLKVGDQGAGEARTELALSWGGRGPHLQGGSLDWSWGPRGLPAVPGDGSEPWGAFRGTGTHPLCGLELACWAGGCPGWGPRQACVGAGLLETRVALRAPPLAPAGR